jgi:hypothetical protein
MVSTDSNRRLEELEKGLSDLKANFQASWPSEKMNMVPGDEMLRAILRNYGISYRKQRDAKELASMMESSEIPHDVVRLLQEIAPKH